jgi:transposase
MTKELLNEWSNLDPLVLKEKSQYMQAIVDISNWKIYRLDQGMNGHGRAVMDDISGFWGLTKNRLLKFRGLNRNTLYLHIKECEFRYNYRNHDMNRLVLQLINLRPSD